MRLIACGFLAAGAAAAAVEPASTDSKPSAASSQLVVALLQMRPSANDQDANLRIADHFCRAAAKQGADVALMPEMFNIGYTRFDPDKPAERAAFPGRAVSTDSPWVQHFAGLARELRMAIAVTYLQKIEGPPRNAVTLFDRDGREVFTYAKVHTSDFKPLEASMTPGSEFRVGTLNSQAGPVQVGAMICFDREQPESARILMLKGAELILTPNACRLEELRLDQFKVRAWENVVGVAMANYPSPDQNGHSVAYDCSGMCLVEAGEAEGVFLARFDLRHLRERRRTSIHGAAYRRPHRYGPLIDPGRSEVWERLDGNRQPYIPSRR